MSQSNFYFLFAGLMILLGLEPFLEGLPKSGPLIQLALTMMLVVGVFSLTPHRAAFRLGLALAAIALASALGYLATDSVPLRAIDLAATGAFCLLAIGVQARQVVLAPGPITLNRVVGALCIYLLLGVVWAILFTFVQLAEPSAFHYAARAAGDPIEHLLYYSFVTLTTLGYGDVAPVHAVARTLAYMEAVVGQLYIAVLIAGLVGRHVVGMHAAEA